MQSGVQGAWGIVPIYLSEIAPPAFRASFAGVAYQLGNMASSGASQIEADAGQTLKLPGTDIADYATIQGILIGCVIAWMLVFIFLGPEANGAHFEQAKVSFQDGAGKTRATDLVSDRRRFEADMLEKGRDVEHAERAGGHGHGEKRLGTELA